ncbi:Major intrinsic protein [Trinorchestia longiramus]|nr:Major intrinsic protein [Trinorchestia longiramus]
MGQTTSVRPASCNPPIIRLVQHTYNTPHEAISCKRHPSPAKDIHLLQKTSISCKRHPSPARHNTPPAACLLCCSFLQLMASAEQGELMGNCAVAQAVMAEDGSFLSINIGYAVGVTLGVLVSGGISGGHINPAVSVAMAVFGKFSWAKVPVYIVAQYTGAFAGALMVFLVYRNALDVYDPERTLSSAGIFATYPGAVINSTGDTVDNFLYSGNGMADQVLGTAVLLVCVCAITDPRNMGITKPMIPVAVGTVVLGIGLSLGLNCGYAINPARDLGPRLFTLVGGWGAEPFTASTADGVAWWWIPVVGPHLGAILGVFFYSIIIELHHGSEMPDGKVDPETATSNGRQGTYTPRKDPNGVCSTSMEAPHRQQMPIALQHKS